MNIYDQIKSDEEELEKELTNESTHEETNDGEEQDEEREEESNEPAEEEGYEDEASEDEGEEEESEEENNLDDGLLAKPTEERTNSDWARIRREKKALERKLEEKNAPAPEKATVAQVESDEPDKTTNPAEWLEWRNDQLEARLEGIEGDYKQRAERDAQEKLYADATQEFKSIEADFKLDTPDYDDAASHYVNRLASSLKIVNPSMNKEQLGVAVRDHVLKQAAGFDAKGLNPAEELYHLAKDNGYTPKEAKKETKVNLGKVNKNRKRSASGLSGRGGNNNNILTAEDIGNMSNGDFARLDPKILRDLESQ